MRRACLVLFFVSAHLALAQENTLLRSFAFVGCYELHTPTSDSASAKRKKGDFLPRRFQLTTRPSIEDTFVARNLDSQVRWDLSMLSSWHLNSDGTVHVVWSTGYVGYHIQLGGTGTELRGTARYFTDTDPVPPGPRTVKVVVQRAECKDSQK